MKIKNLIINQKAMSKVAAFCLVATMAFTGCSDKKENRNNLLRGTVLENACVVTFEDGSKDIAVIDHRCFDLDSKFPHYYSVVSGEYYADQKCGHQMSETFSGGNLNHYAIAKAENITSYLTYDELEKAMNGELDNSDIMSIVSRTINPIEEETNTKTR